MVPKASQRRLDGHLIKFCHELAQESNGSGTIVISEPVCKALRDSIDLHNRHEESIPLTSVTKVLESIDVEGKDICYRIDETIFQTLMAFFLSAQPGCGSERGIYLLAHALHRRNSELSKKGKSDKSKIIVGQDCLFVLLKCFIDSSKRATMRRWIGILLLQLLKDCHKNVVHLLKVSGNCSRQLGDVIVKDANELIRVVCGDIVEVILGAGISAADLWPTGTEPDIYQYFPAKKEEKYWAKDFEDYLDHLDQLEAATQDRGHISGRLYYPQNVLIDPEPDVNFGKPLYMLLDDKDLTIFSRDSADSFYCGLQIPLTALVSPGIEDESFVKSQTTGKLWDIVLQPEETDHCYLNSMEFDLISVRIALPDSIRKTIGDEIELMARQASQGREPRASVAENAISFGDATGELTKNDIDNEDTAREDQGSQPAKGSSDGEYLSLEPAGVRQGRISPSDVPLRNNRVPESKSDDESNSSSGFFGLLNSKDRRSQRHHEPETNTIAGKHGEISNSADGSSLPRRSADLFDKSKIPTQSPKTPAGSDIDDDLPSRVESDNFYDVTPSQKARRSIGESRSIEYLRHKDRELGMKVLDNQIEPSPKTTNLKRRDEDLEQERSLTPQEILTRPFEAPSETNNTNGSNKNPFQHIAWSDNKPSIKSQNYMLKGSPQSPRISDDEMNSSEYDASTPKPQPEKDTTKLTVGDGAEVAAATSSSLGIGTTQTKDKTVINTQHVRQISKNCDINKMDDGKFPGTDKHTVQHQSTVTHSRAKVTRKKGPCLKAKTPLDLKNYSFSSKSSTEPQNLVKNDLMLSEAASQPKLRGFKLAKTNATNLSSKHTGNNHPDQENLFDIPKDSEQDDDEGRLGRGRKKPKRKTDTGPKLQIMKPAKGAANRSRKSAPAALLFQDPQTNPRRSERVAGNEGGKRNYKEIDEEAQDALQPVEELGGLEKPSIRENGNSGAKRNSQSQHEIATTFPELRQAASLKQKFSVDGKKTSSNTDGDKNGKGKRKNGFVDDVPAMEVVRKGDGTKTVSDIKTAKSMPSDVVAAARKLEDMLVDVDMTSEDMDVRLVMNGGLEQDLNAELDLQNGDIEFDQKLQGDWHISISSTSSKSMSPEPGREAELPGEVANQHTKQLVKEARSEAANEHALNTFAESLPQPIIESTHGGRGRELESDALSMQREQSMQARQASGDEDEDEDDAVFGRGSLAVQTGSDVVTRSTIAADTASIDPEHQKIAGGAASSTKGEKMAEDAAFPVSSRRPELEELESNDQIINVEQIFAANENGKRASPHAVTTPAKRQKALAQTKEPASPTPRTSRENQLQNAVEIKQMRRHERCTHKSTPSPRKSRLNVKAKQATANLGAALSTLSPLVDEKNSRKPTIVNFSINGPENQGRSGITRIATKKVRYGEGEIVERPGFETRTIRPVPPTEEPQKHVAGYSESRHEGSAGIPGHALERSVLAPVKSTFQKEVKNDYADGVKSPRRAPIDLKIGRPGDTLEHILATQQATLLPHAQTDVGAGTNHKPLRDNAGVGHSHILESSGGSRKGSDPVPVEKAPMDNFDIGYGASADCFGSMSISSRQKRKLAEVNTLVGQPVTESARIKRRTDKIRSTVNASDEENCLPDTVVKAVEGPPQRRRNMRYSSQSSRVDFNGSPLALQGAQTVDHIGKISEGLFGQHMQDQDGLVQGSPQPQPRQRTRHGDAAAPHPSAPILMSITKAKPLSPEYKEARYIPHKRNLRTGAYEGLDGSEIIADAEVLPDPFTGEARRESDRFWRRLQEVAVDEEEDMLGEVKKIFGKRPERGDSGCVDYEETLINSAEVTPSSQRSSISSPKLRDDLSSPSRSKGDRAGYWLLATKPHYKDLFEMQDRIIEEMRIRLADQENAIHVVWQQYRNKGNTLLQQWENKRRDEMQDIIENLEKRRSYLLTVYRGGCNSLMSISDSLQSSPTDLVEKDWHRKQAEIQKLYDENMKAWSSGADSRCQ